MTNEERQIVINAVNLAKKEYVDQQQKYEQHFKDSSQLPSVLLDLAKAKAVYVSLTCLAAKLDIYVRGIE